MQLTIRNGNGREVGILIGRRGLGNKELHRIAVTLPNCEFKLHQFFVALLCCFI